MTMAGEQIRGDEVERELGTMDGGKLLAAGMGIATLSDI